MQAAPDLSSRQVFRLRHRLARIETRLASPEMGNGLSMRFFRWLDRWEETHAQLPKEQVPYEPWDDPDEDEAEPWDDPDEDEAAE